MLYTVAKLAALLSGVAMAADHSVLHSDETEHIEDESEPQSFTALLSPDVTAVILSFCDTADRYSLKLLNLQMNRSINALIFGKWRSEIEKMIGDQLKMDGIPEGILDCDSIIQVKELVDFCETNKVCFTPRFCGKLIRFRKMIKRDHIPNYPTLPLKPYCQVQLKSINEQIIFNGDFGSFVNSNLIGQLDEKPTLMNIRTGEITELPPCEEARFANQRTIVLFHGDSFQFYDAFNGKIERSERVRLPQNQFADWSIIESKSSLRALICVPHSFDIDFFTLDKDREEWTKTRITYEKSKESDNCFRQFFSPDGSVLIAIESFNKKCSLVNIVDTRTKTIRHTVMLPYSRLIEAKVSRNGAYFETECNTALLLDLNTCQWVCLTEPGMAFQFFWISDSLFSFWHYDKMSRVHSHIRYLHNPFKDLSRHKDCYQSRIADLLYYGNFRFDVEHGEPAPIDSVLCPVLIQMIISFCDSTEQASLKLTNLHICQVIRERAFAETKTRFGDRFIGDYANYMREFEHGIVECESIDQVKESIQFSRSNQMCFTPRFCGKLIVYSPIVNREHTKIKPSLRLQHYCQMPLDSINEQVEFDGRPNSFANDHLIGTFMSKQVLMNIQTGKVTELPSCEEARFVDDRLIVLFHGDKFQFYDLFAGEGGFFGGDEFPVSKNDLVHWSVTQNNSGVRAIVYESMESEITYFTLDNGHKAWTKKTIRDEQSEKGLYFQQFLSPDGSILIASEEFSECSLIKIVDTLTETIRHTVMMPYTYFCTVKMSRNSAYLEPSFFDTPVLMDLNTGRWIRLPRAGSLIDFYWMDDSRFWIIYLDQDYHYCNQIRLMDDNLTISAEIRRGGHPLNANLIYSMFQVLELTDIDSERTACHCLDYCRQIDRTKVLFPVHYQTLTVFCDPPY